MWNLKDSSMNLAKNIKVGDQTYYGKGKKHSLIDIGNWSLRTKPNISTKTLNSSG
jgi:hypothetical protein